MEEILKYYRQKLTALEGEKSEWFQCLEETRFKVTALHGKQDETLQKKIQLSELQKALSESHLAVYDEKRMLLGLQRENEMLVKQEMEDRRKIEELLALTEESKAPPGRTAFKDVRPESAGEARDSMAITKSSKQKRDAKTEYVSKFKKNAKAVQQRKKGIIKTIFLPHEDVNRLRQEIDRLNAYREVQRMLYEEFLAAFEKDREVRGEEFSLRSKDYEAQKAEIEAFLAEREEIKNKVCKNYFRDRHEVLELEKRYAELGKKLDAEKADCLAKLEVEQRLLEGESAHKSDTLQSRMAGFADRYRNETQSKENKLSLVKEQYTESQRVFVEKLRKLEGELERVRVRGVNVEFRRQGETGSFQEDVLSMKKKIGAYEDYIKRLKGFVDKDEPQLLIEELKQHESRKIDLLEMKEEIRKMEKELVAAQNAEI